MLETNCLNNEELSLFLATAADLATTRLSETLIVVHATAGDVLWRWVPAVALWCHGGGLTLSGP